MPVVLVARFLAVGAPITVLKRVREFDPHAVKVLTWGGLRGGISVALALSLAIPEAERGLLVTAAYVVVVFSIIVQGLTMPLLLKKVVRAA